MRNSYLLIRHGESTYNRELRYQGWSRMVPLTELGVRQVEERVKLVKKFDPDVIVASPFLRTRQTAGIFAKTLKKEVLYSNLIIDYRRSESMEGKLHSDFADTKKYKEWLENADEDWDFKLPDGESYNEFASRVKQFIEILEHNYTGKKILIVTHGDIIRSIIRQLTGEKLEATDVANTFVCKLLPLKGNVSEFKYFCEEID